MATIRERGNQFLTRFFSGRDISYRFVFALLIPVVIDQFFLVSFNFINTSMISSSGTAAISAVNMVGSLNIFLVQFFVAIGLGGTVLIAQHYGHKDYAILGKLVNGTVYGAILVATLLAIVFMVLHEQILTALFGRADPGVLDDAATYLMGILISYPFQAVVEGTNGSLRGVGRTKTSLQLSLTMNAIYLGFNIVFVSWLKMGVIGLAISLNISRVLAAGLAIWMLYRNRAIFNMRLQILKRINFATVRQVILVAIPFAAESIFFNGGKIIMQIMIVSLGTDMIAANAIGGSWIQLSEIIPSALGTALVPIVGQSMGRRNTHDARKLTKSFVILGMILFLTVDLILLPIFPVGIQIFNPPAAIVPVIFRMYLICLVMHCLTWPISFVLPNALRAAGDGKFTTTVSLLSMWLFRLGIGYLVGIVWGYGLVGIYLVMSLEWGVRGTIFLLRFRGKKWYEKNLLKSV
ncbi:MATE family efflux transporter [Schleiferilactobacillus perolens]|jgi:putative MATE family efflux protein|uniref:Probable multidrug resistance protein NorM n=1 Tax=Schleiferilactobacillus perolens DSM 12744 TaxID=1423792 RepID=A0A0R1MPZ9_9LACO|nr:MATE family efflux transporter [Schleiferilactobacillus perolens]KRL10071.1 MATE efflux family protein [Schleiferilactobacillus perolens DSM 12744]MCI1891399.1 MATE family efflux transporter [Schleiferilactobacillus harbinensis]MCI1913409.1 MATE family efflux transporter [Schleiferilactobacillus harbinensis]MCI2170349.1 MATE family efflux transporter [Schleiferilactobacillus perolens]